MTIIVKVSEENKNKEHFTCFPSAYDIFLLSTTQKEQCYYKFFHIIMCIILLAYLVQECLCREE